MHCFVCTNRKCWSVSIFTEWVMCQSPTVKSIPLRVYKKWLLYPPQKNLHITILLFAYCKVVVKMTDITLKSFQDLKVTKGKVKSTYGLNDPSGWSISLSLEHKVTSLSVSISTRPRWDASPSQGHCRDLICHYPFIHLVQWKEALRE